MKSSSLIFILSSLVFCQIACSKKEKEDPGKITVYKSVGHTAAQQIDGIDVFLDGVYKGNIPSFSDFVSGTIVCGSTTGVTISQLAEGSYALKAVGDDGSEWAFNNLTIRDGVCILLELNLGNRTKTPSPTGGYNCVNGNCIAVGSDAQYTSLSACQAACSTPQNGYNCVDGNCVPVSGNGQYPDLASCQNNCAAQQTGRVSFYQSCKFTQLNVTIDGQTKQITQGAEDVPLCGNSGTASFDLPAGTYTYKYDYTCGAGESEGSVTISPGECKKIDLDCLWLPFQKCQRRVSFWSHGVQGCNSINVTLTDDTNQSLTSAITSFYPNTIPAYNAVGNAIFDKLPGGNPKTYYYTATCGGKTWSGQAPVYDSPIVGGPPQDPSIELLEPGYGKVTFWKAGNTLGCSGSCDNGVPYNGNTLPVTINGQTKNPFVDCSLCTPPRIMYPGECRAPGEDGAFLLPAGTYQYQWLPCCGGYQYGTVTIFPGDCKQIQLTY